MTVSKDWREKAFNDAVALLGTMRDERDEARSQVAALRETLTGLSEDYWTHPSDREGEDWSETADKVLKETAAAAKAHDEGVARAAVESALKSWNEAGFTNTADDTMLSWFYAKGEQGGKDDL